MRNSSAFKISDAYASVRDTHACDVAGRIEAGLCSGFTYRPFDNRWLYWERRYVIYLRSAFARLPDAHVFHGKSCGCLPLSTYEKARRNPRRA